MKIAVLLSGGVDSSVALSLLRDQGHDLTAFYLKVWLEDELSYLGECPWEADLAFARQVCDQHGVPLEVMALQRAYWDQVVRYALTELKAGRTPSPDVLCNQRIKFGAFLDAIGNDFSKVASGHYARLESNNGTVQLLRGRDRLKDQTYFLSHLSQGQLGRALFPVGALAKSQVRALAAERELANRNRPDSQGICFLGKIKYREFVRHHLGELEGDIRDQETDRVLGRHEGYWFYTIGQRQGLRLSGGPWFVCRKDPSQNIVYVTHATALEDTARDRYQVEGLHWIGHPPPSGSRELQVKVRHGPSILSARVTTRDDAAEVALSEKEPGIAPGQFTVFYDGDLCLGAGTII